MLVATTVGVFFIPLFFAAIEGIAGRRGRRHAGTAAAAAVGSPANTSEFDK
jgi:hypothetical protein